MEKTDPGATIFAESFGGVPGLVKCIEVSAELTLAHADLFGEIREGGPMPASLEIREETPYPRGLRVTA